MKAVTKFKNLKVGVSQFAPNHIEITTSVGVAFQSYDSTIAFVSSEGTVLGRDWDYSITTMKYLGQWLGYNTKEIREHLANGTFTIDKGL